MSPTDWAKISTKTTIRSEAMRQQCYWVLTLPPASSITFTVNPSFAALPRQIPLESLRSSETFEYPAASI